MQKIYENDFWYYQFQSRNVSSVDFSPNPFITILRVISRDMVESHFLVSSFLLQPYSCHGYGICAKKDLWK